jgi:predicted RNA-binding protein YlxR (DUF448 family)
MGHEPERTCIACRGTFAKNDVVRIVAVSGSVIVDYREKLPGRGAYVCPRPECIRKALSREGLSRALHTARLTLPSPEEFTARLAAGITEKIKSLITMSAKARRLAAGYSAVRDALGKGRVQMIVCARDLSDGTKEKVLLTDETSRVRQATLFTKDELGQMLGREEVGIVGIEDRGFADAVWKEAERLKSLINVHQ